MALLSYLVKREKKKGTVQHEEAPIGQKTEHISMVEQII